MSDIPMTPAAPALARELTATERNLSRDRAIAYGFWLFLGVFGAHRFWWGKWGTAIAMLSLPFVGMFLMVVGVVGAGIGATQDQIMAAATGGGVAMLGVAVMGGWLVWGLLDAVMIALWQPRKI